MTKVMLLRKDFILNFQWIRCWKITVLYLYLMVWGVTNWAFWVWGSNCTNCVDFRHFWCFSAQLSPPANIMLVFQIHYCQQKNSPVVVWQLELMEVLFSLSKEDLLRTASVSGGSNKAFTLHLNVILGSSILISTQSTDQSLNRKKPPKIFSLTVQLPVRGSRSFYIWERCQLLKLLSSPLNSPPWVVVPWRNQFAHFQSHYCHYYPRR